MISLNAITKELVLACRQLGLTVSESLAALVARTIYNEATSSFYAEARGLQEADARAVVEESVKKLFNNNKTNPGMETLTLQAGYETALVDGELRVTNIAREESDFETRRMNFIINQGYSMSVHLNFEQASLVWNKILELVVRRCRVPSIRGFKEHNPEFLEKEMSQILESVLPRVGLQRFLALPGSEKRQQLEELLRICHGIRTLNIKLSGGVPLLLDSCWSGRELDKVLEEIQTEVADCSERCRTFELAAGRGFKIKEELLHHRQRLAYWQSLADEFHGLKSRLGEHRSNAEALVADLTSKIQAQQGTLPKEEVYPLFDSLGKLVSTATLDQHLASAKLELRDYLLKGPYVPALPKDIYDALKTKKNGTEKKDTLERVAKEISEFIVEVHGPIAATGDAAALSDHPSYLHPETTANFLQLPLDFQGFCVATLPSYLTPGDPSLGVLQYKGRFCVFKDLEGMKEFVKKPQDAFLNVREMCYQMPQLVQLLRLHEDFPQSSLHAVLQHYGEQRKDDGSTQTPLHFVESHIDPNYEWNEWKLRKDALRMADIRRKTTVSTQTKGSTFRRENETQTWLPRDQGINTAVEKATQSQKWKRFVGGLRGEGATAMKITNFKFEV
ncbi:unnamed protein product [Amoebophrya sp. A25]|nr:unnamed protein product [Amoebophrya sp. A25]|eukprot:GSA25T00007443001.1